MPVVPSHRRFSVLTEGSALKLLLTPETRRVFSPKEREREEGRGEPADVAFASVNLPMPLIQCPALRAASIPHPVVPIFAIPLPSPSPSPVPQSPPPF